MQNFYMFFGVVLIVYALCEIKKIKKVKPILFVHIFSLFVNILLLFYKGNPLIINMYCLSIIVIFTILGLYESKQIADTKPPSFSKGVSIGFIFLLLLLMWILYGLRIF